jgi:hypothetical protein
MLLLSPEEVRPMASATFQQVRAVRSAIAAERRRKSGSASPSKARGALSGGMLRGAAATGLIATGYVACIAGIRWLLALG